MKTDRDAARIVRLWLKEEAHEDASRILDLALSEAADVQQRRPDWLARRLSMMHGNTARYGIAAAVLVAAVVLGATLLPGVGAPTTSPSPSPMEFPRSDTRQVLGGGRYAASVGAGSRLVEFDVTIPDGWIAQMATTNEISLTGPEEPYPFVGFYSVERVYADPCHPEDGFAGAGLAQPPVRAYQLVNYLQGLPGFESSPGGGDLIEGAGQSHFFLSNSIDTETAGCTDGALLPLFMTFDGQLPAEQTERQHSPATNGGTTLEIWVVGDEPNPMLIVAEVRPDDAGQDRAAVDEMIGSLHVAPAAPPATSSPAQGVPPGDLPVSEVTQNLQGGLYTASVGEGARKFDIDVTIPAGWIAQRATVGEISLTGPDGTYPYVRFFSVHKVYDDPCHFRDGFAGTHLAPVNSSELVNELTALPGFETGSVIEVQLGGEYRAMHFFLSNSIDTDAEACANRALLPLFETWDGERASTHPGTTLEVWVVQDGLYPMLILAEVRPDDPGADRAAIDQMIATLEVH